MEGPARGFKSQIVHEMGEKWLNYGTLDKASEISLTAGSVGVHSVMMSKLPLQANCVAPRAEFRAIEAAVL